MGSLVAGACTGLGALPIFIRRRWGDTSQVVMLSVAAGVMLGATVFSLMVPAIDVVVERTGSQTMAALVAAAGTLLGALSIWALHGVVPHEHFSKGEEGARSVRLGKHWLFVLAITLHNFPEGLSVGVAYGNGITSGNAVAAGIGLQNLPEGLAVAAALVSDGFDRMKAFAISFLTGLVEPLGGLVGALAVSTSDMLLPWGLTFAAGAMLFVISGEIIPETHRSGGERIATFSLVAGFVVMMFLDVALG